MAYKGSLVELPLFGTYWVYEHVYNLTITLSSNQECHVHLPFG